MWFVLWFLLLLVANIVNSGLQFHCCASFLKISAACNGVWCDFEFAYHFSCMLLLHFSNVCYHNIRYFFLYTSNNGEMCCFQTRLYRSQLIGLFNDTYNVLYLMINDDDLMNVCISMWISSLLLRISAVRLLVTVSTLQLHTLCCNYFVPIGFGLSETV